MHTEERNEIKRALLGKTFPLDDGRLAVMQEGDYRIPIGVSDGAGSVLLFGVGRKAVYVSSALEPDNAKAAARRAMRHVGRELVLSEQPETVACIRRYRLTRPALLTFLYSEDVPILTAWTGRGVFSFISRSLVIRAFFRHAEEGLAPAQKVKNPEKADRLRRKSKEREKKKREKED